MRCMELFIARNDLPPGNLGGTRGLKFSLLLVYYVSYIMRALKLLTCTVSRNVGFVDFEI